MEIQELTRFSTSFIPKYVDNTAFIEPIDRLLILSYTRPTNLEATLYEPVCCLILQGRKEAGVGDTIVNFGVGESLIVSHETPVVSRVTSATLSQPYIAMILSLDIGLMRSLYEHVGSNELDLGNAKAFNVHKTDQNLIDAFYRYLALAENPTEEKVLGPIILKEIHFRLLMAPHGGMLRRLLHHNSHESNISRAIKQIRKTFKNPLVIPELAMEVGMSPSSFHKHFKFITKTTPLQYQKDLRLLEAKRLLNLKSHSVSRTAYEVGYESATQFSREYARKFGVPPRHDLGPV